MDAKDEVLRSISSDVEKSYSYLLSSEMDAKTKTYNLVDDFEFQEIKEKTERLKDRNIYYIETAGNLNQLMATYAQFKNQNPDADFIITIDHIMLSAKLGEKDDLELMSNTAHTAIRLRKQGAMVILLSQLNGNIEDTKRRDSPMFHHPVKTDLHCGNQIYWACDNVLIIHRPELLGIPFYGREKVPTQKLIHCAWIKARGGKQTNLWFDEDFAKGKMSSFFFKKDGLSKAISKIYVKSLNEKKIEKNSE